MVLDVSFGDDCIDDFVTSRVDFGDGVALGCFDGLWVVV